MLTLIPMALTNLRSNWKLYLLLVVVAVTLKLSYDFGYDRSEIKYQKEIKLLEDKEAERIKILNKNLAYQIELNNQLSVEKSQFEKAQKNKQKKLEKELELLKNEKDNSVWLSTTIPPGVINFLQNN